MATGRPRFDPRQNQRGPQIRINHRIRVPEVRVIGSNGEMVGVHPTNEALALAQREGLDLVEVNPKAVPPVCKVLDFGKYKYEQAKQAREQRRKQTVIDIKEIKLRPKTDDHDFDVKERAVRRFLEEGDKVKFTVRFRGREVTHPEKAKEHLERLTHLLDDISHVEVNPVMEGKAMTLILAPRPQVLQRVAAAKALREKERQKAIAEGRQPVPEEEEEADDSGTDDDDDDDEEDDE